VTAQSVPASEQAPAQSAPVADAVEPQKRPPPRRWLDRKKLLEKVSVSYPKLWDEMRKGEFPLPYYIGTKPMWADDEVDQNMVKRPREPQKKEQEIKQSGLRPPTSLKNLKGKTGR
jgi:predicted DNA-binding transcriptional regulator AlpA